MAAAGEATTKMDAARLRRRCRELITHGEMLKANLTAPAAMLSQLDILHRASRLHGNYFPPWDAHPSAHEFVLQPGTAQFRYASSLSRASPAAQSSHRDDAVFTLSATQAANFAAWARPAQLFGLDDDRDTATDEDAMMQLKGRCDFVQDVATDCSVVASLSAAAKILVGKHAVRRLTSSPASSTLVSRMAPPPQTRLSDIPAGAFVNYASV